MPPVLEALPCSTKDRSTFQVTDVLEQILLKHSDSHHLSSGQTWTCLLAVQLHTAMHYTDFVGAGRHWGTIRAFLWLRISPAQRQGEGFRNKFVLWKRATEV